MLLGAKGFEILLDTQPLIELDPSLKRAFGKLKQLLKISTEVFTEIYLHFHLNRLYELKQKNINIYA